MQEDDTAETVNMLHGLKEASGSDDKIAEIVLRIKDETLSLQEQKNLVGALERDNDDNKNRTSIFLSKNELWRRQTVLETSEKALRVIQEHEDEASFQALVKMHTQLMMMIMMIMVMQQIMRCIHRALCTSLPKFPCGTKTMHQLFHSHHFLRIIHRQRQELLLICMHH